MFGLNAEQVTGQVRTFVAMFSGVAAILGLTWYGAVSEAFIATIGPVFAVIGPVSYLAMAIWSAINKKQANILAMAATLKDDNSRPIVEHIKLAPTPAGIELERATPDLPQVSTAPVPAGGISLGAGNQQARRSF